MRQAMRRLQPIVREGAVAEARSAPQEALVTEIRTPTAPRVIDRRYGSVVPSRSDDA